MSFTGEVIVHIGPHKTGTTTIQEFLTTNYEALCEQGILYPKAGRNLAVGHGRQHWQLGHAIFEQDSDLLARISNDLNTEVSTKTPKKIILSTEVLSRTDMPPSSLMILHELLPDARFTWALFLRAQDELMISLYAERIKRGLIGFPATIWDMNKPEYLDHYNRLRTVDRATGEDGLLPISYELARKDLVSFFAEAVGFRIIDEMTLPERMNESLPWSILYLLWYLNSAPRPLRDRPRSWLLRLAKNTKVQKLASIIKASPPLSENEKKSVMQKYKHSNQKVSDDFFGSKELGFKMKILKNDERRANLS